MNDLISRQAVLDIMIKNGTRRIYMSDVERLKTVVPQVVANISGGVLQGASSDYPVDLYTLDFEDAHEADEDELIEVDGSDARFGWTNTKVDPAFVKHVTDQLEDS